MFLKLFTRSLKPSNDSTYSTKSITWSISSSPKLCPFCDSRTKPASKPAINFSLKIPKLPEISQLYTILTSLRRPRYHPVTEKIREILKFFLAKTCASIPHPRGPHPYLSKNNLRYAHLRMNLPKNTFQPLHWIVHFQRSSDHSSLHRVRWYLTNTHLDEYDHNCWTANRPRDRFGNHIPPVAAFRSSNLVDRMTLRKSPVVSSEFSKAKRTWKFDYQNR